MDKIYPFVDAQILTDTIFQNYGGQTGTSTAFQRSAAYFIAEEWVSNNIGTPIAPATITGTYFYPQTGRTVQLDWMYLNSITEIRFMDSGGSNYYTIAGTANYNAAIRNAGRSIVDIITICGNCYGCGAGYAPYQFQIVYVAGLPATRAAAPNVSYALAETAQLVIYEMQGYGNESVGGVGITAFKNQGYFEKRVALISTVFGSSAKAQWIKQLLEGVRKRPGLGF